MLIFFISRSSPWLSSSARFHSAAKIPPSATWRTTNAPPAFAASISFGANICCPYDFICFMKTGAKRVLSSCSFSSVIRSIPSIPACPANTISLQARAVSRFHASSFGAFAIPVTVTAIARTAGLTDACTPASMILYFLHAFLRSFSILWILDLNTYSG